MPRFCQITGKHVMKGNRRSHAMNATKRCFLPNLHYHRFWVMSAKRFIVLRVSAKGMRMIDKKGIEVFLRKLHSTSSRLVHYE
ncbi:50S ribosomal protein L28 [Blochmannia endosymbiont of Camponotus (Colobopsis) obliquus]|uniref:50S ribosomal protein L28 n=1 Tax=Blochmannia endosymbiont of Camponotus (Colobopsis) obliquus TaxID=1505597 RepID=UPI00061A8262|nr:50S ribosomal protein L28 [Blochmannia endosymbiont of Camponotus (Colobopsis) obliquus]AKC60753.1 50S ribosomal protein L28 [Blochmannia endosymbiont of Camponotus (Colobopsis) obliquus]